MIPARSRRTSFNIWPGFVDGLASVLMVLVFLIMIFVISQLYLNGALQGRDRELNDLRTRLFNLGETLGLVQSHNDELQAAIDEAVRLNESLSERQVNLEAALAASEDELGSLREALVARDDAIASLQDVRNQLANALDQERTRTGQLDQMIAGLQTEIAVDREQITVQLGQIAALNQQVLDLQALRAELEAQILERDGEYQQLVGLSDEQRTQLIAAHASNAGLRRDLAALQGQIAALARLLEAAEARNDEQQAQIVNLGQRLNNELARKVLELDQYRSEFFGRMRQLLAGKPNIQIKGDRFVFQSELLFAAGSDDIGAEGLGELDYLAGLLQELVMDIPDDLDWVLRIDGHTDQQPISTVRFPSNWELSTARAISVAKHLITKGIPPERIAVAGFSSYQPIERQEDEFAYKRNRRIEMKLTQR